MQCNAMQCNALFSLVFDAEVPSTPHVLTTVQYFYKEMHRSRTNNNGERWKGGDPSDGSDGNSDDHQHTGVSASYLFCTSICSSRLALPTSLLPLTYPGIASLESTWVPTLIINNNFNLLILAT
jgi:hypothetical protein